MGNGGRRERKGKGREGEWTGRKEKKRVVITTNKASQPRTSQHPTRDSHVS
jgi:hypothetical protein